MLKVYEYKNCGTCKKALKFLDDKKIPYEKIPIREIPPTPTELKKMLSYVGDIRKLFNTSGQDYKALNMKAKIGTMTETELITLLSQNGNLVKRPFVITKETGLVGFKEAEWAALNEALRRK